MFLFLFKTDDISILSSCTYWCDKKYIYLVLHVSTPNVSKHDFNDCKSQQTKFLNVCDLSTHIIQIYMRNDYQTISKFKLLSFIADK